MVESGVDPHQTYGSLSHRVLKPNGITVGSTVFAGLTTVTDRLSDKPIDHAIRV